MVFRCYSYDKIITKQESDHRADTYDTMKLSYLFDLTRDTDIDSMHFGNKIRFANHQPEEFANCFPKVMNTSPITRNIPTLLLFPLLYMLGSLCKRIYANWVVCFKGYPARRR